ncbi:unnamed protein product [Symbiodinium sp. CCMP2456]|nr:unnamed protein product [Symbiodinium sp. CCMP2456]
MDFPTWAFPIVSACRPLSRTSLALLQRPAVCTRRCMRRFSTAINTSLSRGSWRPHLPASASSSPAWSDHWNICVAPRRGRTRARATLPLTCRRMLDCGGRRSKGRSSSPGRLTSPGSRWVPCSKALPRQRKYQSSRFRISVVCGV